MYEILKILKENIEHIIDKETKEFAIEVLKDIQNNI